MNLDTKILKSYTFGINQWESFMRVYAPRQCTQCKSEYLPTGPAAKYCEFCSLYFQGENARKGTQEHKRRQGKLVGVGSGNAQGYGVTHHSYKQE